MAVLMVPFLRISLPISNIELKHILAEFVSFDGISLPISNIELKLGGESTDQDHVSVYLYPTLS